MLEKTGVIGGLDLPEKKHSRRLIVAKSDFETV